GFAAPVGLKVYLEKSVVDDIADLKTAHDMVQELAEDHQKVALQLRHIVEKAERVDDVFTADLLTARIGAHEEASWMLNALIVDVADEA
ncbi:MAG: ferritin-like domain-containing protein, partial [Cyanobacteria bacterium J06553_1]